MAERFSITKFVPELLKQRPGQRLIARDIAHLIMQTHPQACEDKRERSRALDSDDALLQQIVAEIAAQRRQLEIRFNIKTTEERPRKYYYSTNSDSDEVSAVEGEEAPLPEGWQLGPVRS